MAQKIISQRKENKEISLNQNKKDKITQEQIQNEMQELKRQVQENKNLAEERLNQIKYLQADFDNYKKNFEKEKQNIIKLANENLIKELLIILDDFEASIKNIKNEENKEGLNLLHKKFFQILEKHGLKEIEALGKKFDPNFHEVLCREFCEHEEEKIIEEIQKGYVLESKVIRPSKVKILQKKTQEQEIIEEENHTQK